MQMEEERSKLLVGIFVPEDSTGIFSLLRCSVQRMDAAVN